MAIRFQTAIDNSVTTVQNSMDIKVKNAQEEMQRLLDKIMKYKDDMIDVIDTWKYIKEKGLNKYFNKNLVYNSSNVRMIGVCIPIDITTCKEKKAFIGMRFNNWRNEGGGPYDWYVLFDGEDINIYINDRNEISTVKGMISKAVYDKQENHVVMPVVNKNGWYTKHDYTKPKDALAAFAERIEPFITAFFEEAKNITLKS